MAHARCSPIFSLVWGPWWAHVLGWLAGLVLVAAGVRAVLRGRRHLARVLPSLHHLPDDERIVLFLRAFSDDTGFARVGARRFFRVLSWELRPADVRTEEEQVARAIAPFGRMVALGKPDDKLPPPGSVRHYASDKEWRDEVLGALNRADLVLLAAGAGGGLGWEVDQLVHRNDPTRVPGVLWGPLLPGAAGLPGGGIRQRILRGRYVRAVIWFDSDWTPHLEMLDGRFPLIGFTRRTQRALPRALRPVYQRPEVPVRTTTTLARPWAVNLSVALIATFWLIAIMWFFSFFPIILNDIVDAVRKHGGSVTVTGNTSLAHFLFEIWPVWLLPMAGLAVWMYRVWRGGPIAITMARIYGFVFGILSILVFGVLSAVLLFFGMLVHDFVPLLITLFLLVLGAMGLPTATMLLIRHDVREWIDSRL